MQKLTPFNQFVEGYFEAAVFADLEEEYVGKLTVDDIDEKSRDKQIYGPCAKFWTYNQQLIEDDDPVPGSADDTKYNHAGRDFWYTRNGHGCGYWDGDWPKNGEELARKASNYGEAYLYVGDDGKIYIS